MGAWGTAIFDDDLALDVKADFESSLEEGRTVSEAAQEILAEYDSVLDDEDEGPVVILALAALCLESGETDQELTSKAIAIIDSGEGLERWEDAGPEALQARKNVLQALRGQLGG